jgi:hypothetical protein
MIARGRIVISQRFVCQEYASRPGMISRVGDLRCSAPLVEILPPYTRLQNTKGRPSLAHHLRVSHFSSYDPKVTRELVPSIG